MDWWIWPIALFAVTFAIAVVAVLGGVGGGRGERLRAGIAALQVIVLLVAALL